MKGHYRKHELKNLNCAKIHVFHREQSPNFLACFTDVLEGAAGRRRPLEVIEFDDAIVEFGRYTKCLYDRDGNRVDASTVTRYDILQAHVVKAAARIENLEVTNSISRPVLYQSPIINHWGHFILETMSRTWVSREHPDLVELGSVFPMNRCRELAELLGPKLYPLLSLNGFEQVKIDQPAVRVRLKKCFVPTPSFAMGNGGYADVRHLLAPRRVSERLISVPRRDGRPVYLSRSRLPDRGVKREVVNEAVLEDRLESSGVLVVHPQELTLAEQVEMINTHSVFIGPCGSALHSILFCLPDHAITTFVLTESFVPPEYLLLSAIVDNNAHYLEVMVSSGNSGDGRNLSVDIDATLDYLRASAVI